MDLLRRESVYRVEVVESRGVDIAFLCRERIPTNETVYVADSSGQEVRVRVTNSRRTLAGNWLLFGVVHEGQIEAKGHHVQPIRNDKRVQVSLSVRSNLFPGFTATTRDLSKEGLQLVSDGPLEVGEPGEITLECGEEKLVLWASVRWCRLTEPYFAGLQFVGATASERGRLERILTEGSSSAPVDCWQNQKILTEDAFLQDVYSEGEQLVLLLLKNQQIIQQKYVNPVIKGGKISLGALKRVVAKPLGEGQSTFLFYDSNERVTLELVSPLPEITVSAL